MKVDLNKVFANLENTLNLPTNANVEIVDTATFSVTDSLYINSINVTDILRNFTDEKEE